MRRAAAKQAFSRGFRGRRPGWLDLANEVERMLEQDALQFLSLVNKAGLVTAGAAKVEAAIRAAAWKANQPGGADASVGRREQRRLEVAEAARRSVVGDRAKSVARINLFKEFHVNWIRRWAGQM